MANVKHVGGKAAVISFGLGVWLTKNQFIKAIYFGSMLKSIERMGKPAFSISIHSPLPEHTGGANQDPKPFFAFNHIAFLFAKPHVITKTYKKARYFNITCQSF